MVIVRLSGGLGNQLFQYATGRALAYRNGVPLKLDISQFQKYSPREYGLDPFNITAAIATEADVASVIASPGKGILVKATALIEECLPYYRRSVLKERHFHFDPKIWRAPKKVYLKGYWQSEKYFKDIAEILRNELTLKDASVSLNEATARLVNQSESVSLHIRRGDYVTNPGAHEVHGICSLDYYHAAIEVLTARIYQPRFFVFSDDLEWVRSNLRLKYPVTYVSQNGAQKDYEDLRLMSQCKHHIIANSSFSWWGAWLCAYARKIVIAPEQWFNNAVYQTKDLIPAAWIQV
jgi:hypothetical protein